MEKKFKLPKEFALKWVEALRSGKYKQGIGSLARYVDTYENDILLEPNLETVGFCCLGLGGYICGYKVKELKGSSYLSSFKNTPEEIRVSDSNTSLVYVLTNLNDGTVSNSDSSLFNKEGYIFRHNKRHLNFAEIADFIEDNVEFV